MGRGRGGRGGRGRGGGGRWNRKRKNDERNAKSGKERTNGAGYKDDTDYTPTIGSNPRMEAYYSLIGLHDTRYDVESKTFVPCVTDEEKHEERNKFLATMRSILPASFRIDRSLDPTIRQNIIEELQEFVGKEMELELEIPKRSEAFGAMKHILEVGADVVEEAKPEEDKADKKVKPDSDNPSGVETSIEADEDSADDNEKQGQQNGSKSQNNNVTIVKKKIAPAKPIPFINIKDHDKTITLGYQLSVDRRTLRRNQSLLSFHKWLRIHTDCGHITRQETVSMIPPVVLNAKEGMSVLDLCAAPGSKTCQLLEVVGGGLNNEGTLEPTGFIVANDADSKRAYMLVNQLRRMNSPAVFVTSCDGQYFPILDAKADKGTEREGMFDRVLCDVPCSGDGTVRKNPGIWKQWNQLGSLALHPLQLSIALRGARVTKVGGYMVYSTCSQNPIENESVVAELLRISEGALVLEDPRGRMEGLIARPGWSSWKVLREDKNRTRRAMKNWNKKNNLKMLEKRKEWEEKAKNGECPPPKERSEEVEDKIPEFVPSPHDTIPYVPPAAWDEASLRERTESLGFVEYATFDDVEPDWRRRVRASCFPPTEDEAKEFQLHKSLRCLPQDMDTGGFYVALLKKVKPLGARATEKMNAMAQESKGGVDVEVHLEKDYDEQVAKVEETVKSNTVVEGKDIDETQIESSNGGASKESEDNDFKSSDNGKAEGERKVERAPRGKHIKKTDLSNENFVPISEDFWPAIVEHFGLTPAFPKQQYMSRASGESKVLYFISRSIKENLIDRGIQDRITVINSGLKGFERQNILRDCDMSYRVAQEGIQFLIPYMTKRILTASIDDFHKCIRTGLIKFDGFSESFRKVLEPLEPGSFVVALEGYEKDIVKKMFVVMWRCRGVAMNCLVAKVEMEAIIAKLRALGYVGKEKGEQEVQNGADKNEDRGISNGDEAESMDS